MKKILLIVLWQAMVLVSHAAPKPNILVILTDDAGYADFSCYGSGLQTPNIDSIASNGVRFTQGYVSASVCSPSRAGLMTGRYQQRFGHQRNLPGIGAVESNNPAVMGLDLDQITMADALKAAGYRTGIIGKWHLGEADHFHPNRRGFDYFCGLLGGHRTYFLDQPAKDEGQRIMRNGEYIEAAGYATEFFTDEALKFMAEESDQPFFLYLSYTAVHGPMDSKPDDEAQFPGIKSEKRRKLAGMTRSLDREMGRILNSLRETGMETNTLVVFLNDNGGPTDHNASYNYPLRGTKGTEFEGGNRVAFIMQYKGVIPGGMVYDEPVISFDILPTAVALAEGELKKDRAYDGTDLLPYLKGEVEGLPHKTLFWHRYKVSAVRDGDWKLIETPENTMLFNLKDDASEKQDLSAEHPEKVNHLQSMIASWKSMHTAPHWDTAWTVEKKPAGGDQNGSRTVTGSP